MTGDHFQECLKMIFEMNSKKMVDPLMSRLYPHIREAFQMDISLTQDVWIRK
jgi:hypothetical protein